MAIKHYDLITLFIFFLFIILLTGLMLGLNKGLALYKQDSQKLSSYECGFEPFGTARGRFNVQYFLVGVLFLIFDLEIAFLFPWTLKFFLLGKLGYFSGVIFLLILGYAFVYEWKKNALDW